MEILFKLLLKLLLLVGNLALLTFVILKIQPFYPDNVFGIILYLLSGGAIGIYFGKAYGYMVKDMDL